MDPLLTTPSIKYRAYCWHKATVGGYADWQSEHRPGWPPVEDLLVTPTIDVRVIHKAAYHAQMREMLGLS